MLSREAATAWAERELGRHAPAAVRDHLANWLGAAAAAEVVAALGHVVPASAPPHRPAARPRPLPCVHRGPTPVGERLCPSCRGMVRLKVFACALYGECVLGGNAGLACCAACDDYVAAG